MERTVKLENFWMACIRRVEEVVVEKHVGEDANPYADTHRKCQGRRLMPLFYLSYVPIIWERVAGWDKIYH